MKKYAVDIGGKVVTWKNGKYECDDAALLKKIKDEAEDFSENPMRIISLDGSALATGGKYNPEENWAASYALLQELTGNNLRFIAGEKPTWEALGCKLPDGAIP